MTAAAVVRPDAPDLCPAHPHVLPADPARAGHALVRRLPASADTDHLRARLAAARHRHPVLAGLRLWVESVPVPAGAETAGRRRDRETSRPLRAATAPIRAVLLTFEDGAADLVLVGHRATSSRALLRAVAGILVDGEEPGPALDAALGPGEPLPTGPAPDWGVPARGARGGAVLSLPPVSSRPGHRPTPRLLAAATALVVARYAATAHADLLVLDEVGSDGRLRPVRFHPAGDTRLRDVADAGSEPLPPSGGCPAVALVLTAGRAGERYVACLAPLSPVTVGFQIHDDGAVDGTLHVDAGMIHPRVAAQLARHLTHTVDALLSAGPQETVRDLDLPDDGEAARVVAEASGPAPVALPDTLTIVSAFERIARAHPDAPALEDEHRTLTYAQLRAEAALAADHLRSLGVRPGDRVGICLERTADLVVTMLAVLGAQATYVPMDPRYPVDRLAYTSADAGLTRVVTDLEAFPGSARRVPVSRLRGPGTGTGLRSGSARDTAYVMYTSGSTGRPKGVAVPQRNVLALVAATRADLHLSSRDVWTLFHSGSFDFSVWEIWGCLLTGGRLVVVPYWTTRSPEEFHDLLHRRGVTVLNQTPSAFAALSRAGRDRPGPSAVRLLIFGGEALDPRALLPWWSRRPHTRCRAVNMYGITETTVHVTAQDITPVEAAEGSRSVGRPIPGWSVSVRDDRGRVQPFGVPGEIWVGGAGVARGYLNRPELTAERFVEDPVTGQRRYRSGDLGRLHPDGRLDHLGRIDRQVKVRGFRIELDEVRSVLLEDPSVTAAAVLLNAAEGGDGADTRIEAFLVGPDPSSVADVRRRAAARLPDFMVPATIAILPELPLTVNGKVDEARLREAAPAHPAADAARAPDATVRVPPAGPEPVLATVLAVWRAVLGRAAAGDDDFFATGGNSLLAVRLTGALGRSGLPAVSLRELYLHPTPVRLAGLVAGKQEAGS